MPLSLIAALEAMTGLMIFAIITGLLYGRFADPSAKILFSKNMLVSSFGDDLGLQFQIVNKRKSTSMDFNARVIYSHQERDVKFEPMYSTNANNIVELDFSKLDAYQKLK